MIAISKYGSVNKMIEPKRKALKKAEDQLEEAETNLNAKKKDLEEVRSKIREL